MPSIRDGVLQRDYLSRISPCTSSGFLSAQGTVASLSPVAGSDVAIGPLLMLEVSLPDTRRAVSPLMSFGVKEQTVLGAADWEVAGFRLVRCQQSCNVLEGQSRPTSAEFFCCNSLALPWAQRQGCFLMPLGIGEAGGFRLVLHCLSQMELTHSGALFD